MTTIRILIYTDSQDISESPDAKWSISILKDLIESKKSPFVEYKLEVINRYKDFPQQPERPQKLTDELLAGFDEIWFFGTYLAKVEQPWERVDGGRDNELDDDEIKALTKWMSTGGVLMSGDHSLPDPNNPSEDTETFLSMGRALGHRVPRAGQLRKWEGPPTAIESTSFDTLAFNITIDTAQEDEVPQVLTLARGDGGSFHRLLVGQEEGEDVPIDIFPDHLHEGQVELPGKLECQWPPFDEKDESKKPQPKIIAHGCDKRFCQSRAVLAVYDGDGFEVGRIVADSSLHHYLDLNLRGLKNAVSVPVWGLLSQFYINLAFYLAPFSKRQEISRAMLDWIVHHPDVLEERGNHPIRIGRVALSKLLKVVARGELAELLQLALPAELKKDDQFLDFPLRASEIGVLPSQELIIGSLIAQHYRIAATRLRADTGLRADVAAESLVSSDDVIGAGLKEALRSHQERLKKVSAITDKYLSLIDKLGDTNG